MAQHLNIYRHISKIDLCTSDQTSSDGRVDMAAWHMSNGLGQSRNLRMGFWWNFKASNVSSEPSDKIWFSPWDQRQVQSSQTEPAHLENWKFKWMRPSQMDRYYGVSPKHQRTYEGMKMDFYWFFIQCNWVKIEYNWESVGYIDGWILLMMLLTQLCGAVTVIPTHATSAPNKHLWEPSEIAPELEWAMFKLQLHKCLCVGKV